MEQNCKYNLEFSRFSREMHGEVDRGIDGNGYGTTNTISIGVMSYSRLVAYNSFISCKFPEFCTLLLLMDQASRS